MGVAADLGLSVEAVEFPEGTKTSAEAAAAVGCDLAQIAKSLVFMADDEPIVVMMAGDRRVDTNALADIVGAATVKRASLEECREATGFAAGGTPAFGHARPLRVFADVSLQRNDVVWSAAGTPTTVFPIALSALVEAADATWVDTAE
jgi:prolyl-tRNA editing enzyme YbaK/EbsC (Cys-tRNA(Pro) deacylase)